MYESRRSKIDSKEIVGECKYMTENSAGFIFDSLLCYTIVICKTFLKIIQETMKTRRVYELSGQPSYILDIGIVQNFVDRFIKGKSHNLLDNTRICSSVLGLGKQTF